MTENETPKISRYIGAGSPQRCFLPSCQKPFEGRCFRGEDHHFYCSRECADEGRKVDLARVEELRPKTQVPVVPTPMQKLFKR
jgi:hypothetical protein